MVEDNCSEIDLRGQSLSLRRLNQVRASERTRCSSVASGVLVDTLNVLLLDSQKLAMPRGGSKPGERRGGRQKGSLNKLSIGRMKAQVALSAREFDPYDQLEISPRPSLNRHTPKGGVTSRT